ncbi:hypothetical protein [Hoeflea sp.]|uniref:hypothetical protein n=1 Tax=Hoeflea sp. TaxID=1940281 RepID=UPI0019B8ACF6|nr:hypothetical protein [Hoeflea sp.]MBC7285831.1 hypothetical protein [Hoeflea sp.]
MHLSKPAVVAFAALAILSSTARAEDWPKAEVDRAIKQIAAFEKDTVEECVASMDTHIVYDVEQRDINADGVNELIVKSFPDQLGNGVTGCYGMTGQNIYLMASLNGAWINLTSHAGDDGFSFVFHPRQPGEMPDIEVTGPGFCFPIQRFYKGAYDLWKVCTRDGVQIFADAAPWIDFEVVPHDFGEAAAAQPVLAAPAVDETDRPFHVQWHQIFDHNGSDVVVRADRGTIVYATPKSSISGAVSHGTVLFEAEPWDPSDPGATIQGTAYVFKKGCPPAPYTVAGRYEGPYRLVLKGAAPVRSKSGCKVIDYRMNGNSTLQFLSW